MKIGVLLYLGVFLSISSTSAKETISSFKSHSKINHFKPPVRNKILNIENHKISEISIHLPERKLKDQQGVKTSKSENAKTRKVNDSIKLTELRKNNSANNPVDRTLTSIKQIKKSLIQTEQRLRETGDTSKLAQQVKAEQRFQAQLAHVQDMSILKSNPTMAPIVEMTAIMRNVAVTLKNRKIKKKLRIKRNHELKLKRKKTKLLQAKLTKETAEVSKLVNLRKTRKQRKINRKLKERLTSLMGGNDEVEMKLDLANDEFGILTIIDKVNRDLNQILFMSAEKMRGLKLSSRALIINGEKEFNAITEKIDNVMGMNRASDVVVKRNIS